MSPMVKAWAESVLSLPAMMISDRPLRIEYCPVISAARDGVQAGSTRNWVSRRPSFASWSIRGVGAPRNSPPPYGPRSPYPTLSARMKTTLGFLSCASAGAGVAINAASNGPTSHWIARCPVMWGNSYLSFEREDPLPVVLHASDEPAVLLRFVVVERLRE